MNIFKKVTRKLTPKQAPPPRKPSPLLLEMQEVNVNLQQIAAMMAAQKAASITITVSDPNTADFEPFEPTDSYQEARND